MWSRFGSGGASDFFFFLFFCFPSVCRRRCVAVTSFVGLCFMCFSLCNFHFVFAAVLPVFLSSFLSPFFFFLLLSCLLPYLFLVYSSLFVVEVGLFVILFLFDFFMCNVALVHFFLFIPILFFLLLSLLLFLLLFLFIIFCCSCSP